MTSRRRPMPKGTIGKAVSKAQQSFMAVCEHNPQHARGACPSQSVAREFAKTPTKNLPGRKEKR
jgi:hypothetical protein